MTNRDLLLLQIEICDKNQKRLSDALLLLEPLFPITPQKLDVLETQQLGLLDMMTGRFAKLQDGIGRKVFPVILEILQEDVEGDTFIDRLNRLEKLGVLDSVEEWDILRDIRNSITHDYPGHPEYLAEALNQCWKKSHDLISLWLKIKDYITRKVLDA